MCWYQFLFLIRVINSWKQSCSLPLLPMGGLSCRLFRWEKTVMSQKRFVPAWPHHPGWSSPREFWTGQSGCVLPRAFPLARVMGCTPFPGTHHGHQRLRSPLPLGLQNVLTQVSEGPALAVKQPFAGEGAGPQNWFGLGPCDLGQIIPPLGFSVILCEVQ